MSLTLTLIVFFSGFAGATFAAAGLFFLRFWRASRDRFFLYFGMGCTVLGFERLASTILNPAGQDGHIQITESAVAAYSIRLVAFVLILIGIWEKNRTPKQN